VVQLEVKSKFFNREITFYGSSVENPGAFISSYGSTEFNVYNLTEAEISRCLTTPSTTYMAKRLQRGLPSTPMGPGWVSSRPSSSGTKLDLETNFETILIIFGFSRGENQRRFRAMCQLDSASSTPLPRALVHSMRVSARKVMLEPAIFIASPQAAITAPSFTQNTSTDK
jgi:hypothetical protein